MSQICPNAFGEFDACRSCRHCHIRAVGEPRAVEHLGITLPSDLVTRARQARRPGEELSELLFDALIPELIRRGYYP